MVPELLIWASPVFIDTIFQLNFIPSNNSVLQENFISLENEIKSRLRCTSWFTTADVESFLTHSSIVRHSRHTFFGQVSSVTLLSALSGRSSGRLVSWPRAASARRSASPHEAPVGEASTLRNIGKAPSAETLQWRSSPHQQVVMILL